MSIAQLFKTNFDDENLDASEFNFLEENPHTCNLTASEIESMTSSETAFSITYTFTSDNSAIEVMVQYGEFESCEIIPPRVPRDLWGTPATPTQDAIMDKGYEPWQTGGGCMCFGGHLPNGNVVYVCDDDSGLPETEADINMGTYGPDHQDIIGEVSTVKIVDLPAVTQKSK